jgi:prepilin-type N-terminal cleavage/methylation domain-containing protein
MAMNREGVNYRHAFTLVELLVVIAIIGVLVALLLPAVQAAREAARRTQCINNLKQVGLSVSVHHDARKTFPQGRNTRDPMGVSWAFRLLPYLEERAIHDAYDATKRVDDDANATAMRSAVSTYFCPSRRAPSDDRNFDNDDTAPRVMGQAAGGDFAANAGTYFNYDQADHMDRTQAGPIFTFSKVRARHVTDGISKTFAVGERHIPPPDDRVQAEMVHYWQGDCAFFAADTPWGIFADTQRGLANTSRDMNRTKYGSEHDGITMFVFLDGHVDPIDNDTDLDTLRYYCSIGDGNDPTAVFDPGGGGT